MTTAAHDIVRCHDQALESTRRFVAGIAATQWNAPTPCEGWDVRALLNHVVAGNFWAAELSGGATIESVGDRLDGDLVGNDPLGTYDASAKAASAAFGARGAMDAPCAVSYGPIPGAVYAGHRFIDVLVHGWDLATATGQDARLDPGLVDACFAEIEPQIEQLEASGMFGDRVEVPADADRQARLLGLLGRG
jgi:uncharacterized protein (TIGR03086 family)